MDCGDHGCAVDLKLGQRTPFAGTLIDLDLGSFLFTSTMHCNERIGIAVIYERDLGAEALRYAVTNAQLDIDTEKKLSQLKTERIYELQSFYRQPWFVVPATVAITVATVLAIQAF